MSEIIIERPADAEHQNLLRERASIYSYRIRKKEKSLKQTHIPGSPESNQLLSDNDIAWWTLAYEIINYVLNCGSFEEEKKEEVPSYRSIMEIWGDISSQAILIHAIKKVAVYFGYKNMVEKNNVAWKEANPNVNLKDLA